ncbi:hypothetical protein phytr_7390 [Candidatus Phycorickettsia trachydisci]|uniref:Uncharacterized protein n=1 Tax=Candidatus Phycorickettsia trachydisci TaxID=2115978 RepID=A0A2P1P8U4_9RICK|nr:ankyrin repeat domain-containing protein [Candidatus Phycorickettsia trachydisci]AVP87677.1 hypothetical protein phytr_7390 [Candidatus Phycorickettsia trachydisci]
MAFSPSLWWQKVKTFFGNWTPTWIKQTFWPNWQNPSTPKNEQITPISDTTAQETVINKDTALKQPTELLQEQKSQIQEPTQQLPNKGIGSKLINDDTLSDEEKVLFLKQKAKNFKTSALFHAINLGSPEEVKLLIQNGCDINERLTWTEDTPLHYAVLYNRPELIRMLVDAGADIEAKNLSKLTPFATAKDTGKIEICEALAKAGANTDVTLPDKKAAVKESNEIAQNFLQQSRIKRKKSKMEKQQDFKGPNL